MIHLGLTGYPLERSLSPKIHSAALRVCGVVGEYSLYPVSPDDVQGLKVLLDRLRNDEINGLNVTIPHKQNVVPLLDELTPAAQAIGAVNTIFMRSGRLIGENTDAAGFLADLNLFLREYQPSSTDHNSALVLGAGGSGRAVVYALLKDGWQVTVAARRQAQACTLLAHFQTPDRRLTKIDLDANPPDSMLSAFSLLVNTTPVGMSPEIDRSPWPAGMRFPQDVAVYDLVYDPRRTRLVKQAGAAGLPARTGLGMLIEQAVLAFEIWTGQVPPRNVLLDSVID
jgi:shikimate dehydrogenase